MALIKNTEYTVEIVGYTAEGAGVARIDGCAVFIPCTLVGETVRVKIIKVAKNLCYGKAMEILVPSPERLSPECPVFPKCGGCDLWHMSRNEELKMKTARVRDVLERIGGFESPIIRPIIAEPCRTRYRNKSMFPVSAQNNEIISGFYRNHSHDIIPCSDCIIQSESANALRNAVCELAQELCIPAYNEADGSGILRNIYVRSSEKGDILCLIVRKKHENLQKLADILISRFPNLKTVCMSINKTRGNTLMGESVIPLSGDTYWSDTLCGFEFKISPLAFYQVNRKQAERLYEKAVEYANPDGCFVLDLYCGAGTITLCLARQAKRVLGVEIVPRAIEDALRNAQINGIENVDFLCADATNAAAKLAAKDEHPDVIVVDPPRKGMDKAGIEAIVKMNPARIVYVSCDPATLARDLKILCESGYTLKEVTPVDMFPATRHVESVALLCR